MFVSSSNVNYLYNFRERTIDGTVYHEKREEKILVDLETNSQWKRTKVVRRIGNDGMMSKVIDVFLDDKNVWHKETSSLEDENELQQFKKDWIKAWKKAYKEKIENMK